MYTLCREEARTASGAKDNDSTSIRGNRVKNSTEFVIAAEHPLFSSTIDAAALPTEVYLYFHWKNKPQWNALFMDGHAAPVLVDKARMTPTTTVPPGQRYRGDGFNLERLPI